MKCQIRKCGSKGLIVQGTGVVLERLQYNKYDCMANLRGKFQRKLVQLIVSRKHIDHINTLAASSPHRTYSTVL